MRTKRTPPTVKCDEKGCGWNLPLPSLEEVAKWYNKPCPRCGKGVIVNDAELMLLAKVIGALRISDVLDPTHSKRKRVRIESAKICR